MCLGIPGEVVALDADREGFAIVDVAGARRSVDTGLLDDVAVGDWVVVHVGFALSKLEPDDAHAALRMLEIDDPADRRA